MPVQMLFVVGSPRSGSTMLERMLSSHSAIQGGPEPHLLTPLAHAGVYAAVDDAPYDPARADAGLRAFVASLPGGESDYWAACRAYCDVLYGRLLEKSGRRICLDKTPAYALVLPFLAKVFPDGKYVVLTRHPAGMFCSFANSFFDGNLREAQRYNPLLDRYVPALAQFLRQREVPCFHVRYEDLVSDPELWMQRICGYVGVPFEPDMVDYGKRRRDPADAQGLGDPIGVRRHTRPSGESAEKWVSDLASDRAREAFLRELVDRLDPEDLATLGYRKETLWQPLERAPRSAHASRERLTRYRLQRRAIIRLRNAARRYAVLRRPVEAVRAACETLLGSNYEL